METDNLYTKAPKNGYCFIYLSNQSNEDVFFDNLQVRHDRARIIEENHYYPYGLKIAAISSQKLADNSEGIIENNFGYQGDYSAFDEETGWNDFELRSYDPQIGRFIQNDPYDQFASGYVGMANDPINNVDPSGGSVPQGAFSLFMNGIDKIVAAGASSLPAIANTAAGIANAASITSSLLSTGSAILNSFAQFASFTDWFRSFRPGYTYDITNEATKRGFWGDHYKEYNYPAITRIGRIYQDAVIRSLDQQENTVNLGGTEPDMVPVLDPRLINFNDNGTTTTYDFPPLVQACILAMASGQCLTFT